MFLCAFEWTPNIAVAVVNRTDSCCALLLFFFSSRRRHTRSLCDWSSDVCSSDLSPSSYLAAVFVFGDVGRIAPLEGGRDKGKPGESRGRKATRLRHAVHVPR